MLLCVAKEALAMRRNQVRNLGLGRPGRLRACGVGHSCVLAGAGRPGDIATRQGARFHLPRWHGQLDLCLRDTWGMDQHGPKASYTFKCRRQVLRCCVQCNSQMCIAGDADKRRLAQRLPKLRGQTVPNS